MYFWLAHVVIYVLVAKIALAVMVVSAIVAVGVLSKPNEHFCVVLWLGVSQTPTMLTCLYKIG